MAKSKKKKQKDFQKVKLKVGKKKPRGLNETVATFKTRSINIKEQLKDVDKNEITTKRKLNIQEVLVQCQHYSASIRNEGLVGLKELVYRDSSILHSHIAQLLEKVSPMMVDKDGVVRSSQCKLFKIVFPLVSTNTITPFFSILCAHLCCAMTHIHEEIQIDCLNVLDLCLEFYPGLVTNHSRQILPNFLEQISHTKGESKARTLRVNPSSKLSSEKGRVQVLRRLHHVFRALLNHTNPPDIRTELPEVKSHVWANDKPLYVDLQAQSSYSFARFYDCPSFRLSDYWGGVDKQQGALSTEELASYVEMLLPLLIECWVEACPAQLATNLPGNALARDAFTTLSNVLGILRLLLQLCHKEPQVECMKERYLRDFVRYFMPHFPYVMHQKMHSKGKQDKSNKWKGNNISMLTLNLELCQVMSHFMSTSHEQLKAKPNPAWKTKIFDFLLDLETCELEREQVSMMIAVVGQLLNGGECADGHESLLHLVHSLYQKHLGNHATDIKLFLEFFADLVVFKTKGTILKSASLDAWMCALPRSLYTVLSRYTNNHEKECIVNMLLYYMRCLAPRKHHQFLRHLDALLFKTLLNDKDLKAWKQVDVSQQNRVIQSIYWIPFLNKQHLSTLAKFCVNSLVEPKFVREVLDIVGRQLDSCLEQIKNEIQTDEDSSLNICGNTPELGSDVRHKSESALQIIVDFLSFLATVALGNSVKTGVREGQQLNTPLTDKHVLLDPSFSLNHEIRVAKECAEMFQRSCTLEPIEIALLGYVMKLWNSKEELSLTTCVACVHLVSSAITRFNISPNRSNISPGGTCPVTSNDMDCSSEGIVNTEACVSPTILNEISGLEEFLNDVLLAVASALVAVETGTLKCKEIAPDINTETLESNQETAHMSVVDDVSDEQVVCSQVTAVSLSGASGGSSAVFVSSVLLDDAWHVCRKCLQGVVTMRTSFPQFVINKLSESSSCEDVEIATGILSQLSVSNEDMLTSEIELLQDFVKFINQHFTMTQQFWSDFMYKISMLT